MPYFVFKVHSVDGGAKRCEFLDEFDGYRDAKTYAKEQRKAFADESGVDVRMTFAEQMADAETLICKNRPKPVAEEWE